MTLPEIPDLLPEHGDPIAFEVFRSFRRAMMTHRHVMLSMLAKKGAHPGQAHAVWMLSECEGITQRDFAERLHVSRPTVTNMLQRMEKSGVITRHVDESDQRLTRIYLTDEGRQLLADLREVYGEFMAKAMGPMPDDDRRELVRLLDSLAANLEQHMPTPKRRDEAEAL